MKPGPKMLLQAAEGLAIQALTFIAGDEERLGRFLAATGIGPGEIRAASSDPGFLAGVLDYLSSDERLVTDFATEGGIDPASVEKARHVLGGAWERDIP